ncbi:MAG TPA: hypothetical protein VF631_07620 [Allosphingosinicella sp.]|jgi:hypothetical protein|uniref:hypothetical protein n=1 Tax=Allosphingosinicella sp. TaxID=2823234 RepID=UPI002F27F171
MTTVFATMKGHGEAAVEALRAEFGAMMAERILEAEAADFLWEARVKERYLGQHIDVCFDLDEDETELARIAVLSFLGTRWQVGACLLDGEGAVADLLWKEGFDTLEAAEAAFNRAA